MPPPEPPPIPTGPLPNPPDTDPTQFQLSSTASFGGSAPQTLWIVGTISGHLVTVLIDTGSSHNIIQPRLAAFLQLSGHLLPSVLSDGGKR